ncbi:MAG: radical SAM family heme chaperone HemW [Ignavibacteriae bacterium]|nr:radical SAM family heme chaperone HemW [Ignavibacteria bacterium]MBI3364791.1 radical SAM family heme chaperone HemW [Ignavibacteriota bacterium]
MASLYVHIPFCEHKCIYCDFYSIESLDPLESFLTALRKEIAMYAEYSTKETIETIFFGGGTPSLLSPAIIAEILDLCHRTFSVRRDAEITLETNPGTVDRDILAGFRAAGVNRLSFGVQSFHEDDLRFLTRIHSAGQAKENIRNAQKVGFDNISLDLIFALPNQTLARWKENLQQAIVLDTQHISAYSLIVEHGTPLARMVRSKQVSVLPLDTEAELYEFTMACMRDEGFEHYEVSNYAKPGFRSRHNSNYWNHTNYIGFGPSAHSFWMNRRWWNIRSIESYCEKILAGEFPLAGEEHLTSGQYLDEAIMLGLRGEGIHLDRLNARHGIDLVASDQSTIDNLISECLLVHDPPFLRLTDKGYLLCDEISKVLLAHLSVPA